MQQKDFFLISVLFRVFRGQKLLLCGLRQQLHKFGAMLPYFKEHVPRLGSKKSAHGTHGMTRKG
ncbi:MAG: hypothetical protein ACQEQX_09815, partial [Thermodesulfobacteriota bacterium]